MQRHVEGSPSGSVEAYLDGARAVAVISVVVFHAWVWSGSPHIALLGFSVDFVLQRLGSAIDLFFLLSGFLLARPWFAAEVTGARPPSLRRYFTRRLTRLVPAYYLSIVVLLALFIPSHLVPAESVRGSLGAWNVGAHLLFLQHVLPVASEDFNGMDGPYWTLSIEMLFYLALPFAVRLFTHRRALPTLMACLAFTEIWVYLALHSFGGLTGAMVHSVTERTSPLVGVPASAEYMRLLLVVQFPAFLFTFALGILLARIVVRHRAGVLRSQWVTERISTVCIAAGVAGLAFVGHVVTAAQARPERSALWIHYVDHTTASALLALVLFGLTFGPDWVRRPLEALPMRFTGWISYGIYLYHVVALNFLFNFTALSGRSPLVRFGIALAVVSAISLVVATVSWMTIERPLLLASSRRRVPRPRSRSAAILLGVAVFALPGSALALGHLHRNVRNLAVDAPLGAVRSGSVVPRFTGAATPMSAAKLGVIYGLERQLLTACGATSGQTEGLSSPTWGMTGSVFACRDPQAAAVMLATLGMWEAALGYAAAPAGVDGVQLYRRVAPDASPADPYHFHVRYRSAAKIIGVAISAMSESAGRAALKSILDAATRRHPVSR